MCCVSETESISAAEFKEGILSLQTLMEHKFSEAEVDKCARECRLLSSLIVFVFSCGHAMRLHTHSLLCSTTLSTHLNRAHRSLISLIDVNKDGYISYAEFFDSFRMVDPKLAEAQAFRRRLHIQRKPKPNRGGSGSAGDADGDAEMTDKASSDAPAPEGATTPGSTPGNSPRRISIRKKAKAGDGDTTMKS